jgi:hypothetical protein
MVKRLESSFHAFKLSLATLLRITDDMLKMFAEDKVIIAPDLNVKDLQAKGMELDEIIEKALEKGYNESDILYKSEDFDPDFIAMLQHDKKVLEALNAEPMAEPKILLENMKKSVDEFAGDAPQFDDLTMLGVTLL